MESRLEQVLKLVIEDFIKTAEPVGSQALVTEHGLDVSPATVRNWFAELVEQGMLVQPHTSAGRIPSERAFRWYVETQLGEPMVGKREQAVFEKIVSELAAHDQRAKAAAKACASAAGIAAIVGSNSNDSYYTGLTELFGQPEFRDWSRVVSMGSVLDKLDERLSQLRRTVYSQPTILIGADCPFGDTCGSIVVTLPGNSLLALLGPMRMPYRETRNLLTAVVSAFK
jgi:transcriptional regulator of heat shock response